MERLKEGCSRSVSFIFIVQSKFVLASYLEIKVLILRSIDTFTN